MSNKGFTLIEVLIWISISIILMISVWILVSWWIDNIVNQEKVFKNSDDFTILENKLNNIISNIDTSFSWEVISDWTNSWVILKINNDFNEWWFIYIWVTPSSISSWDWIYCLSGSEDINTNHIFIKSFIPFEETGENIFSNFNNTLNWNTTWYKSYVKEHIIRDSSGNIIVWKGIFWDKFESDTSWKNIYLNSPTGLARNWDILFISDTLNNRILYYDIIKDRIYKLLDENDWLIEPTGLYYDNLDNALYISNSWNREILKFYSKNTWTPKLTLTWVTDNNISEFNIEFFDNIWAKNIISKGSIEIENHTIVPWDSYSNTLNKVKFTFSWWTTHNFTNEYIKINNIGNFSASWTYYAKLDINNKIYPFFNQSDNNLLTTSDNKLEIYDSWLNYETWFNWNKDSRNEFLDSIYSGMSYDKKYDYILKTPIKNLSIDYNTVTKLLNLKLTYYKKYNCYNLDDKIERTFLIKKNFK